LTISSAWEPTICLVETAEGSPPGQWFQWVGQGLPGSWLSNLTQIEQGLEPRCDIYVIERELWRVPLKRLRSRGARIFCWLDDAFGLMPLDFETPFAVWRDKLPLLKRLLGQIDGVILPSPILAADFAPFARQAYFIPNYHRVLCPPVHAGVPRRWGWGGTSQHVVSWRETRFYEYIPADVTLRVVGTAYCQALARDHCRVDPLPWMEYRAYLAELASWECCLIPISGEYDLRRSWIKALECCLVGTPWLAIGDAIDIYRGIPGGACYLDAVGLEGKVDSAIRAATPESVTWAKAQHMDDHFQEWKDVLFA
jgi:hypothetical protein